MSIDEMVKECAEVEALGIGGVILFGLPETKDEMASGAYDDNGIVQRAIRAIKREVPSLLVMTDVCNCEYTSHGHCGYVKDGDVDNDTTLQWLAKSALSACARRRRHRGAVGHDGRPRVRRSGRRWTRTVSRRSPILAYAAKFASACFTGRSARRRNRRRSSATAGAIRWIRPTGARRCAKSNWIWKKART